MSDALNWIHSFDRFNGTTGIKPGLERMEAMLSRIGNPHHQLRFVHVAGTNGKGSTCAYLASVLEAAGYRVGLYTSPYLTSFYDRMRVSGHEVSAEQLEVLSNELRAVVEEVSLTECGRPTEFEVVTALALLFYARQQVDIVVLETGLGGRLDSTNVVTPLLSLITNVGRDHQAILGDTLEQIAAEKAGIIKPGVPVLSTATGVAQEVIERTAEEQRSSSIKWGMDFAAERTAYSLEAGQTFDWQGLGTSFTDLQIGMIGAHQIFNASLAVAAIVKLREMGYDITEQALREGLARTRWAGRLEVAAQEPLTLLDGAHNPEGAAALERALREFLPGRRLILVIGILADKAIPDVLGPLLPLATAVIVTAPDLPRAADVDDVAAVIRSLATELPVQTSTSVADALQQARQLVQRADDAIVITGSLFTISEARALLVTETE